MWLIFFGFIGVIGTGLVIAYLRKQESSLSSGIYWLVGLTSLFPVWLISVLALLGNSINQSPDTPLPPSVLFSSSVALLGVIATDWIVRRLQRQGLGYLPFQYWFLGTIAFMPAWVIALYFIH